jgi:hypothetical protein
MIWIDIIHVEFNVNMDFCQPTTYCFKWEYSKYYIKFLINFHGMVMLI